MSNPLIDKFYELHPEKKEKPKKVEFEGTVKLSEEQMDIVSKYLTTPDKYSTQSTITTTNLTSSGNGIAAITAANPYATYYGNSSNYSSNDEFFKVANEIQKGNARVVSVEVNREILGKTSVKFEVVMDD
jgi:hypothetical protein